MSKIIGVIDEPVPPGSTDNLDLKIHSKSLIDFVQQTNTPITVGIQGEWGSGKTSLLNSIYHAYTSESTFKQIWINSWEYSLLSTPEEALLKIINRIIEELLDDDVNVKRKNIIKDGAKKIFRGALRVGAQVALGDEAAKVTDELMGSSNQSISALRENLKDLVSDIEQHPTNPLKKIIVYVDDLDRIEPRNAVAILELLKNIFSIPNCVFILAIDYQVVVKGLEHKYGKRTHENEWEFRAFFDKIIQLPFMMPMGQYNIGKYVNALLVEIGFVQGDGLEYEGISEIILHTIGGNPRSIKRLVNSISLIQIFVNNKKELSKEEAYEDQKEEGISDKDERFLLFSLLCLQIAYPPIYSLLVQEPDFIKWDDALAFSTTKGSEERDEAFQEEFKNAQKTDDFDEDWEKVLYRICYERPRLKPRVADISRFFSYIKDELFAESQENIGETIARLLTQTSVTSVSSSDQGQISDLPEREGAYKRRFLEGIDQWLQDKKTNERSFTENKSKLFIKLHEDINNHFSDIQFKFAGEMTCYVSKHKFLGFGSLKDGACMTLIKHYENDYKIPNISGLNSKHNKKYCYGKATSMWNAEGFYIDGLNLDNYDKFKESLFNLFEKSYEMAKSNWDKRLIIDPKKLKLFSYKETVENDENEVYNLAKKYLDPDYRYDL